MMDLLGTCRAPLGTLGANTGEATAMSDGSRGDRSSRYRRRRRRHRPHYRGRRDHRREVSRVEDQGPLDDIDDSLLTPDERSYRMARAKAEEKVELYIEAGKKALVVLLLLIIPPLTWLGVILLIVWGLGVGKRLFQLLVEPELRERECAIGWGSRAVAPEASGNADESGASIASQRTATALA